MRVKHDAQMHHGQSRAEFPKLWVTTQKWVAKHWQVGRETVAENINFLSFILVSLKIHTLFPY